VLLGAKTGRCSITGTDCRFSSCGGEFVTAETNERYIDELVELRDASRDLKLDAESYIQRSRTAQASLARLTKSLDVLRALDIYQAARATRPGRTPA
jgi:hypothetical protein